MLIIAASLDLSPSDRQAVYSRTFQALRSAARAKVRDDLGDGYDHAVFLGEAAAARDALVRPIGGGRLEVDPELYAGLDDDEGIVVLAGADADINPPVPGDDAAAGSEAHQAAADAEVADAPPVEPPAVEPDTPPAAQKAPARKAPAKKAAAKKAPARKSAPKKAPAKKAAATKSAG